MLPIPPIQGTRNNHWFDTELLFTFPSSNLSFWCMIWSYYHIWPVISPHRLVGLGKGLYYPVILKGCFHKPWNKDPVINKINQLQWYFMVHVILVGFDDWLMSGCQSVSLFVSTSDRSRFVRQQLTDLVDESFQRSIQSRPGGDGNKKMSSWIVGELVMRFFVWTCVEVGLWHCFLLKLFQVHDN